MTEEEYTDRARRIHGLPPLALCGHLTEDEDFLRVGTYSGSFTDQ